VTTRGSKTGVVALKVRFGSDSISGMVFPLDVSLELRRVEVDFTQVSGAVSLGFIVEVWRGGIPALTSCGYGPGVYLLAKFDYGNEAVSARSIPLFCTGVRPRAERCQRTHTDEVKPTGMLGAESLNG